MSDKDYWLIMHFENTLMTRRGVKNDSHLHSSIQNNARQPNSYVIVSSMPHYWHYGNLPISETLGDQVTGERQLRHSTATATVANSGNDVAVSDVAS